MADDGDRVPAVWELARRDGGFEPVECRDADGRPMLLRVMRDVDASYDDALEGEPCAVELFGRYQYASKGDRHDDMEALLRELYEDWLDDETAVRDVVTLRPEGYRLAMTADGGTVTLETHERARQGRGWEWVPQLAWPAGGTLEEGTPSWDAAAAIVGEGFDGRDPFVNVPNMWQVGEEWGLTVCDLLVDDMPAMVDVLNRHMAVDPVWAYDHSGLALSAGPSNPYRDPWDSGCVGLAYMTPEDVRGNWMDEDVPGHLGAAHGIVEGAVGLMDAVSQGDAYCYVLEDADGRVADACGGFYGRGPEVVLDMLEQAGARYAPRQPSAADVMRAAREAAEANGPDDGNPPRPPQQVLMPTPPGREGRSRA